MNCDNCRWFNKTGFVPGFGDCTLNREVHSANHEACEHYEECEPQQHEAGMRLIDANRLKEVFERNTGYDYHDVIDIQPTVERPHEEWTTESAIDYLTNIGWLTEHDRILTERPHGEWQTLITKGTEKEPIAWKCSVCGKSPVFAVKSDFCPRCGADMRKEGDDK